MVWATGFTPDWSYVRLPIFDGTGYPAHRHGVTTIPGVYVIGLPWLWTWGSGRFLSVGRDAEFVVQQECSRASVSSGGMTWRSKPRMVRLTQMKSQQEANSFPSSASTTEVLEDQTLRAKRDRSRQRVKEAFPLPA